MPTPSRYSKTAMRLRATTPPRVLSLAEFCTTYGLSRSKAYLEIAEGRLQTRKIGRLRVVTVDDAEAWLASFAAS